MDINRFKDQSNPRGRAAPYVPSPGTGRQSSPGTPAAASQPQMRPVTASAPQPVTTQMPGRPLSSPQLAGRSAQQTPQPVASAHRPLDAPAASTPAQPHAASTNVSINISFPKLQRPKLPTLPKLPYKRIAIIGGIVATIIIIGLLAWHFTSQAITRHREYQAAHQAAAAQGPARTKPNFIPLVPAGEATLASAHSAFDGTRDTYSFSDTFKGTSLTVSQQPVPASFKSSSQAVATVAKSLGATTPVLASSGTGYLATDQKSGSQTVIFALNDVLVFVQSPFSHTATDWASYLGSLK